MPAYPGETFSGRVGHIGAMLDKDTRTIAARIEVANADGRLKPEMFADVVLRKELGDALFVPESAVLKPGERRLVFLDLGDGRLEPREIQTGARVEGGYAVLSGLAVSMRLPQWSKNLFVLAPLLTIAAVMVDASLKQRRA